MGERMGYYLRVQELVDEGYGYNQACEIALNEYPNLKNAYKVDKQETEEIKEKEWY